MTGLATLRLRGLPGLLLLLVAGCSTLPDTRLPPVVDQGVQAPEPAAPSRDQALDQPAARPPAGAQPPAVVALLEHAEHQANAGDLEAAAVTLERAIRIDARNPVLWHHLASVRLAEGEAAQAEQLAAKSNSLAPGNRALQARNWQLIAEARRSQGDAQGARAAEQRARDARRPSGS
jgi:tetratricopeptide (TPR) repeat protein